MLGSHKEFAFLPAELPPRVADQTFHQGPIFVLQVLVGGPGVVLRGWGPGGQGQCPGCRVHHGQGLQAPARLFVDLSLAVRQPFQVPVRRLCGASSPGRPALATTPCRVQSTSYSCHTELRHTAQPTRCHNSLQHSGQTGQTKPIQPDSGQPSDTLGHPGQSWVVGCTFSFFRVV